MKRGDLPLQKRPDNLPRDFLQKFIEVFGEKGWLNRSFRILHREKKYRIFCDETQFIAHRINDHGGMPWGFPCWVVCLVTLEQMIEEPDLAACFSVEPTAHEWLRCLAEGDFKIL